MESWSYYQTNLSRWMFHFQGGSMTSAPTANPTVLRTIGSSSFLTSGECKAVGNTGLMLNHYANNESRTYYLKAEGLGGDEFLGYATLRWVRIQYSVVEPLP